MKDFYNYLDNEIDFHYNLDLSPNPEDFTMHMHTKCEFYCILSGKGVFRIEGSEYPLQKGDILIMRPAETHYVCPDKSVPYERISIHFDKELFSIIDPEGSLTEAFFNRPAGALNRFSVKDFEDSDIRLFIERLKEKSDAPRLQIIASFLPILYELYLAYIQRKKNPLKQEDSRIVQIISYINDNISKELSLDSLCDSFFISKSQLCRSFKKATASTVWDYITAKRLIKARQLIQGGENPTKVYSKCGFSDYSSFYRAYKSHFNCSPKEANIHPYSL